MDMKKIRVLHFELDSHLGGIESFLLNLFTQIDKNKVEFEFVTSVNNPALGNKLEQIGGIIHKVSSHKNIYQYCKDIDNLLKSNYDVIHIHKNSAVNIIPIILAKKNGAPLVILHSHNTAPSVGKGTKLLHYLNRGYLNRVANIKFACSKDAGYWMFGENAFQVVPNGIMTSKFRFQHNIRVDKRKELGISDSALVIGHIGRFTPQKNHDYLIDIFQCIANKCSRAILLLVGDGELKEQIKTKVKSLGLEKRVIFTGIREDIAEILMCMDAFVMPSLYEGLPIVGVEAQASGLPLILSDTISKDTEISDAVTWISLNEPEGNMDSIIMNQIKMSSDELRQDRNMQVKNSGYDISETARKILDVYEEIWMD